jgi:hypothetical protein
MRHAKTNKWAVAGFLAAAVLVTLGWANGALAQTANANVVIRVQVYDGQRSHLGGATVTIAMQGLADTEQTETTFRQGQTDGTGGFVARGLTGGFYRVSAEAQQITASKVISVLGPGEAQVEIVMPSGNMTIRGTVVDSHGLPVSGVTVTALRQIQPLNKSDVSNSLGGFEIAGLPDGRYDLVIAGSQGVVATGRQAAIGFGQVVPESVTLVLATAEQTGAVTGQVVSSELLSSQFSFAVVAVDAAGVEQAAVPLERGQATFALTGLPPGTYSLRLVRISPQNGMTREVGAAPGVTVQPKVTTADVVIEDLEP